MFTYPVSFFGTNQGGGGGVIVPTKVFQIVLSSSFPSVNPITNITITKCPLRYDKKHALTYEMDDQLLSMYSNVFRLFNGGLPASDTVTSQGLKFTDGFGNNVNFKGNMVGSTYYTSGNPILGSAYANTNGSINWQQHLEMYNAGWGLMGNHGAIHNYTDVSTGTMEYWENKVKLEFEAIYGRSQIAAILQGGNLGTFDSTAWANYLIANCGIYLKVMGSSNGANQMDVSTLNLLAYLSSNNTVLQTGRYRCEDDITVANHLIAINTFMQKTGNWWFRIFSHRVDTTFETSQMLYTYFKTIWQYVYNTYGANGLDNVWVPSVTELIEYMVTKEKALITSVESVPKTHDISFDFSQIPANIYNRSLTFKITSELPIQQVISSGYNLKYKYINDREVLVDLTDIKNI